MEYFPASPADVLNISKQLKFIMGMVCNSAKILKFWDRPYMNAATDLQEMTLIDKLYWVYKCRNPVIKDEKGSNIQEYFKRNRKKVQLPSGFEQKSTVKLSAVGDLIPFEGINDSKDIFYQEVSDLIFENDISYANLESPITHQELKKEIISDKESPVECCSRNQFNIIKGYRDKQFTVLHTSGNHIFDMGIEGIVTTQKYLNEDGIISLGINKNTQEQLKGKIIDKNGIKVGFASATFGLNGNNLPENKRYMANVAQLLPRRGEADVSLLEKQINFCKKEGADFIIVSLHWGYEFEFFPRKKQIDIAHSIIEYGADAIIAHHPHVVQPVEYYQTKRDNQRIAVIAYSLGSLLWSYFAPYLVLSEILNLTISKGVYKGEYKTYIKNTTITPVYRKVDQTENSAVIKIKKLEDFFDDQKIARPLIYSEIKKYADLVF